MTHQTYICFDYGERRIGLAVGQTLTGTATPLQVIAVRNGSPEWDRIRAVLEEWRPAALVVGHPVQMDGSRQLLTELAEKFSRRLAGRYHLPVYLAEERLTTTEARARTGSREAVDSIAAQVILESWLADPRQARMATSPQAAGAECE